MSIGIGRMEVGVGISSDRYVAEHQLGKWCTLIRDMGEAEDTGAQGPGKAVGHYCHCHGERWTSSASFVCAVFAYGSTSHLPAEAHRLPR